MSDNKDQENESLMQNAMEWVGGWGAQAAKGMADAANKALDQEYNQKRLVFIITIKNHYQILNEELENKHFGSKWKYYCWKGICCGLWSCQNCCCYNSFCGDRHYFCSCCFVISTTNKGITKDIAGHLDTELTKDNVQHNINVINDTDIEITLLHISQSWIGKVKELAVENIAPIIIKQQIHEILKKFGAKATISTQKRAINEEIEDHEEDLIKNDGKYL